MIGAYTTATGDAGNVELTAGQLALHDGAKIGTATLGEGQGGTIHITVSGHLTLDGKNSKGGASTITAFSQNGTGKAGKAGEIRVQANTVNLTKDGTIATSTAKADGGDITITTPNLLYLQQGQITTSVKGGKGDGGNITIDRPQFVVVDKGQIKAQADAGHGGNIHLVAQQFLKTPDSLISASSRLGLDGQVLIDSPAEKISGSLLVLATTFTDVSGLLPGFCTELSFEEFINRSSFTFNPIVGSSPRPDDLKPSSLLLSIQFSPNFTKATMSNEKKVDLTQRLAWLTGCHR